MKKLLFSVFALAMTLQMQAKVKLQPMFSDNMVLQRNTSAPIWGETRPGRMVSVVTSWNAKTYRAKADKQGRFTVSVDTPNAGGPYEITISDGSPIVLRNILIGEVWICSGQSNMEMPMQGWDIPMNAEEIAQSDRYTGIRLLHVEHAVETAPKTTIAVRNNGWATWSPQTVKDFSATAFFFGKKINETERVPVGLIMTCWGGTPIESWISPEKLRALTPFSATIQEMQGHSLQQKARQQKFLDDYKQWIDDEIKRSTAVDSRGRYLMAQPGIDDSRWETTYCPAVLTGPRYDKYDGGLWFRKTIEIPTHWAGKPLEIRLAKIDDDDVTFFNGEFVGTTYGYQHPRRYIIPARLVKKGPAQIAVYNLDFSAGAGIWGEPREMTLSLVGSTETISLAGEWKVNTALPLSQMNPMPKNTAYNQNAPSVLFNSMISPLIPYAIRGAIWYQGEANAPRAYQYRDLLPIMVNDWRARWQKPFSFYIMQLANYKARNAEPVESDWAELREAQQMAAAHLVACETAVNIDIGMANDIHPISKDIVGDRLARLALALDYKHNLPYSGPRYQSYLLGPQSVTLTFQFADALQTSDGQLLRGFTIAGADRRFYNADAVIKGNTVEVSSPHVPTPLAVRYAWADNPDCNLINAHQLPASPFRTDDWPGITINNR